MLYVKLLLLLFLHLLLLILLLPLFIFLHFIFLKKHFQNVERHSSCAAVHALYGAELRAEFGRTAFFGGTAFFDRRVSRRRTGFSGRRVSCGRAAFSGRTAFFAGPGQGDAGPVARTAL